MGFFIFIIPPEEKNPSRWIRLKEAAHEFKIGKTRLKELANAGKIVGGQDPDNKRNDWVFDRETIQEYKTNHFSSDAADRKKVLQILKGVG